MVKGLQVNLLGLPAIRALHFAARLDDVDTVGDEPPLTEPYIHTKFPKLFQGLGNLGDPFEIKLKPGATPFSLFTPRCVPLPLREVAEELGANGDHGSNLESRCPNSLVCRHGGGPEKVGSYTDLRGSAWI